jgi:DNA-binding transcriptional ArsR family regulator
VRRSAVSHQLRVLREAALVKSERHGKRRVYTLYGDVVRELLAAARHLAAQQQPGGSRRERAADAAGGQAGVAIAHRAMRFLRGCSQRLGQVGLIGAAPVHDAQAWLQGRPGDQLLDGNPPRLMVTCRL